MSIFDATFKICRVDVWLLQFNHVSKTKPLLCPCYMNFLLYHIGKKKKKKNKNWCEHWTVDRHTHHVRYNLYAAYALWLTNILNIKCIILTVFFWLLLLLLYFIEVYNFRYECLLRVIWCVVHFIYAKDRRINKNENKLATSVILGILTPMSSPLALVLALPQTPCHKSHNTNANSKNIK